MKSRLPDAGEVVWADFDPIVGHEQSGLRPALVISPFRYNSRSSLLIVCPITRTASEWPFFVKIINGEGVSGFVIVDQIRSIDAESRVRKIKGRVTGDTLREVRRVLGILAEIGAATQTDA